MGFGKRMRYGHRLGSPFAVSPPPSRDALFVAHVQLSGPARLVLYGQTLGLLYRCAQQVLQEIDQGVWVRRHS